MRPEQFENIILRADSRRHYACACKDVARVELGLSGYGFDVRLNDKPGDSVRRAAAAAARTRSRWRERQSASMEELAAKRSRRASSGSSRSTRRTFITHAIEEVIITPGRSRWCWSSS